MLNYEFRRRVGVKLDGLRAPMEERERKDSEWQNSILEVLKEIADYKDLHELLGCLEEEISILKNDTGKKIITTVISGDVGNIDHISVSHRGLDASLPTGFTYAHITPTQCAEYVFKLSEARGKRIYSEDIRDELEKQVNPLLERYEAHIAR